MAQHIFQAYAHEHGPLYVHVVTRKTGTDFAVLKPPTREPIDTFHTALKGSAARQAFRERREEGSVFIEWMRSRSEASYAHSMGKWAKSPKR